MNQEEGLNDKFRDEVFIDGKKVLDIPIENIWHDEWKLDYKTYWSDIKPRKKIIKKGNVVTKEGIS